MLKQSNNSLVKTGVQTLTNAFNILSGKKGALAAVAGGLALLSLGAAFAVASPVVAGAMAANTFAMVVSACVAANMHDSRQAAYAADNKAIVRGYWR